MQVVDLASPSKAPAIIAAHETALAHIAMNSVRFGRSFSFVRVCGAEPPLRRDTLVCKHTHT